MNKLLLVDGSSLLNSQYFGNIPNSLRVAKDLKKKAKTDEEVEKANEEIEKAYKDLLQTSTGIYTNGVYGFVKYLFSAIKVLNPTHVVVTWDVTRDTFRRDMMPEYKGNRGAVESPLKQQFKTCQELLAKMNIKQFFSTDYESDDYCGSLVEKFENDSKIYILTKDHDFFQLVSENTNILLLCQTLKISSSLNSKYGINEKEIPQKTFLVNPTTLREEYGLTPEAVTFVKGIAGDTADNIPGIPNIGDTTALALSNIYKNIEDLYSDIEGKSDKEIEEVVKKWKDKGIKRNPLKYLTATDVFTNKGESLSAKEIGLLSEKLATIKTDIEVSDSIDDLSFINDTELFKNSLKEYEITSIKF